MGGKRRETLATRKEDLNNNKKKEKQRERRKCVSWIEGSFVMKGRYKQFAKE